MNMRNNTCPCCGGSLLRHVRPGGVYWFCQSCWQEVPLLAVSQVPSAEKVVLRSRTVQPLNS